jgi:hypothetical protein
MSCITCHCLYSFLYARWVVLCYHLGRLSVCLSVCPPLSLLAISYPAYNFLSLFIDQFSCNEIIFSSIRWCFTHMNQGLPQKSRSVIKIKVWKFLVQHLTFLLLDPLSYWLAFILSSKRRFNAHMTKVRTLKGKVNHQGQSLKIEKFLVWRKFLIPWPIESLFVRLDNESHLILYSWLMELIENICEGNKAWWTFSTRSTKHEYTIRCTCISIILLWPIL